jgi:transcriptional regulator with GAF, ATPase, and Fis domain
VSCAAPWSGRCCWWREQLTPAGSRWRPGSPLTEGFPPREGIDLEQLERSLVVQALERSGWNHTRAAALLGINRDQIRYRIEKFKLERLAT